MKKIKAPIDGKNVTTDWIEEIFDHCNVVGHTKEHTNRLCGYINGELVEAMWVTGYNMLFWQVFACKDEEIKPTHDEIRKRLTEHEDPDRELFSEISVKFHNCLCQSFYWRQEDED